MRVFGSDIAYIPDGTFSGVVRQNIAGYSNDVNVFGRWNMQVMRPNLFRLQLWFVDMTTAGAFRLLDADHMQSLENNDQGFTHAADVLGVLSCRVAQRPTDWNEVTAEALSAKRLRATLQRSRRDLLYSNRREAINRTPGGK